MTNLWPSINTLRMEATRLRQTSRRVEAAEDMDIAATLLEAAGEITEDDINRGVHGYVDRSVTNLLEAIDSALPDKVTP